MIKNIHSVVFDHASKRYRYKGDNRKGEPITGSFISRKEVVGMYDRHLAVTTQEFIDLAPQIKAGKIGAFADATDLLRKIHVANAVIEAGGIDKVSDRMWGKIGQSLKTQYYQGKNDNDESFGLKHLFKEMIDNPNYSEALLRNRLRMYANSGAIAGNIVDQARSQEEGATLMSRSLGVTDAHCADCVRFAGMGWLPIGDLPLPQTQCACKSNCKCSVQYR